MTLQGMGPGQFLPADWKVREEMDQSIRWAQGKIQVLPYFLSPGNIEATIRSNADRVKPFEPLITPSGQCAVIQFNTGCYYTVCVKLARSWLGMIGESTTWMDGHASLDIQVEGVYGQQQDQAGAVQTYLVKLLVEGATLSIHIYNTKHKVTVQGNNKTLVKFTEEVFNPFLERESGKFAPDIKQINDMMVEGKRGQKRTMNPATS